MYRYRVELIKNKGDKPIYDKYTVPSCGKSGSLLADKITKDHGVLYHWYIIGEFK